MPAAETPAPRRRRASATSRRHTAARRRERGRDVDWPNPAPGRFDGVEAVPGVAKPDPILVVDG